MTLPLVIGVLKGLGVEVTVAPDELDIFHCADLITASGVRIAVRVREFKNERYQNTLTIRSTVISGRDTELQKFLKDPPQVYFYGVTDATETSLSHWRVCDGAAIAAVLRTGKLEEHFNDDGTGWVDVDLKQKGLVVRSFDDDDSLRRLMMSRLKTL